MNMLTASLASKTIALHCESNLGSGSGILGTGSRNLGPDAEHYVFLHGWGLGREVWKKTIAQLSHVNVHCLSLPGFDESTAVDYNLDQLLLAIETQLPNPCHLIGYSLGGLLAQSLLESHKVLSVCSVAAGPRFIADETWPQAMAESTYASFVGAFERDPEKCLRRFIGLQILGDTGTQGTKGTKDTKGDASDSQQKKRLLECMSQLKSNGINKEYFACAKTKRAWAKALSLLAEIDNCELLKVNEKPVHFLLGEQDKLMPISMADAVLALNSDSITLNTFPCAHNLPSFLAEQKSVELLLKPSRRALTCSGAEVFDTETDKASYHLDKLRIAQSFSKAARSYDGVAGLQRQVCRQLFKNLHRDEKERGTILDLGSGTGFFNQLLEHSCTASTDISSESPSKTISNPVDRRLINLDLAEGMLCYARSQHQKNHDAKNQNTVAAELVSWVAADAEALPLCSASVDCLFSSLAIQWCQQEETLFQEVARVLKPGAKAHIATLGPSSLWQLRQACSQVDDKVHVNRFSPWSTLHSAITSAGLKAIFKSEEISLGFDTFKELRHELKALGAQNMNAGQAVGLFGRKRLNQLLQAYEQFRQTKDKGGQLALSYEVYYLQLEKPLH